MIRLASFAACLTMVACSSVSTTYDWDQQFDFSSLETWDWVDAAPRGAPDDLTKERIQEAIATELTQQGYRKVEESPDFLVSWAIRVEDKMRAHSTVGYGDPYYDRWTGYYGPHTVDIDYYEVGSLIVDVIDPAENRLVWRGTVSRALERSPSPERRDEIVRDAVTQLFEPFPPG